MTNYSNIETGKTPPRMISIRIEDQVRRLFLRNKFFSKKINNNTDFELPMYYDSTDKKCRSLSQIFGYNAKNGLIRRVNPRYNAFGILKFGKPLPKTISVEVDGNKTIFLRRNSASKKPVESTSELNKINYQSPTSAYLFTVKEIVEFAKKKAKKSHKVIPNYAN